MRSKQQMMYSCTTADSKNVTNTATPRNFWTAKLWRKMSTNVEKGIQYCTRPISRIDFAPPSLINPTYFAWVHFDSSNFDWSIFTLCRQPIDWLILIHQISIGPFLRRVVNRLIDWFWSIRFWLVHFYAVPSIDWLIDFDSSNFVDCWSVTTTSFRSIDCLIFYANVYWDVDKLFTRHGKSWLIAWFWWIHFIKTVLNSLKPGRWVFTSGSKIDPWDRARTIRKTFSPKSDQFFFFYEDSWGEATKINGHSKIEKILKRIWILKKFEFYFEIIMRNFEWILNLIWKCFGILNEFWI